MSRVRLSSIWLGLVVAMALLVSSFSVTCFAEGSLTGLNTVVFPLMSPRVSSKFGPRKHPVKKVARHHNGIDLAAPKLAHVRAVSAGVVLFADKYSGFGKLVTIKHKDSYVSLYGHLAEILVNPGSNVSAGQLIGRVGSTGLATGPHLHFEWRLNGKSIDPLKVFPNLAVEAEG